MAKQFRIRTNLTGRLIFVFSQTLITIYNNGTSGRFGLGLFVGRDRGVLRCPPCTILVPAFRFVVSAVNRTPDYDDLTAFARFHQKADARLPLIFGQSYIIELEDGPTFAKFKPPSDQGVSVIRVLRLTVASLFVLRRQRLMTSLFVVKRWRRTYS